MTKVNPSLPCPHCHGPMQAVVLGCPVCQVRVEAEFASNEFATLDPEHLHFLRIFIHSEGKIREMEAALGVSYPTIKARMAKLKETLAAHAAAGTAGTPKAQPPENPLAATLRALEAGMVSFEEALRRIKGDAQGGEES